MFTGFILRILYSVMYNEWNYLWYGILGFGVMMVVGNLMFRAKQWGGGDTKLIMGIGIIFATRPSFLPLNDLPFLAVMVINILIVGALYGIVYGIILATKNRKQFFPEAKKINHGKKMIVMKICALFFAAISALITVTTELDEQVKMMIGGLALLLLVYPYLTVLIKGVEKVALMKHLPLNILTP
ncbi:MAG: prepilin peptidase [Nanoarchaeota archaeon]